MNTKNATKSVDPIEALKKELSAAKESDAFYLARSPALLKELHLLTRDGQLNQDARRKLKQVLHLIRLLLPMLETWLTQNEKPHLVDVGAGKSYLGFLLYDLLLKQFPQSHITSVENRPELITKSTLLAAAMNATGQFSFENATICDSQVKNFQMLVALHACDTATDDAIVLALKNDIKFIALVPCCQAEVNHLLKKLPHNELWPLWRQSLHSREFGSHLTNVIRCLVLESRGYKVTVTEFTGWEHSQKNELILAEKLQRSNSLATKQLTQLLESFPIEMKLLAEIKNLS